MEYEGHMEDMRCAYSVMNLGEIMSEAGIMGHSLRVFLLRGPYGVIFLFIFFSPEDGNRNHFQNAVFFFN